MDNHPISKPLDPLGKLTSEAKGGLSSESVILQLERLRLAILEGQYCYDLKEEGRPALQSLFLCEDFSLGLGSIAGDGANVGFSAASAYSDSQAQKRF